MTDASSAIRPIPGGVSLNLVIIPRAGRDALAGVAGDSIRIRLAAPPVEGRANKALVTFLAEQLRVSRSTIRIVSGATTRRKIVHVIGLSAAEATRLMLGPLPAP